MADVAGDGDHCVLASCRAPLVPKSRSKQHQMVHAALSGK